MKRFISGVLVGTTIAGSFAYAATHIAEDANFAIFVNGKEMDSVHALAIDGSTYLPLKAIADILDVPVKWNEEERRVEVGELIPEEDGLYSRTNPAPLNTAQTYTKTDSYFKDRNYTATIKVIEVIRGEEAWEVLRADGKNSFPPAEGYEYMIVKVDFTLLSKVEEGSVQASSYDFDFYSSNNEEYNMQTIVEKAGRLDTGVFPGGTVEGYVVGNVKKDDPDPKLVYRVESDGTGGLWFALK